MNYRNYQDSLMIDDHDVDDHEWNEKKMRVKKKEK